MTNTRGLVKKLLAITKIQQLDAREYLYYSDLDKASRLAIEQPLKNYLLTKIPSLQEDAVGNLYLINSGTPLVCAHLDNVGSSAAQQELANVKVTNGILKGTKNIGADDKVGVAIALQLYANYGDKISLLFTVGEETGGIGSASFSTNYRALLESCSYCIIADRRGASDIIGVGNNYCTVEFRDAVKPILSKYGYKTATGLYSDADNLNTSLNCINLSCGYYDAHSDNEYVVVSELLNCYSAIDELVSTYNERLAPVVETFSKYSGAYRGSYSAGDNIYEPREQYEPLYINDGVLHVLEDVTLVRAGRTITLDKGEYDIYDKDEDATSIEEDEYKRSYFSRWRD